MPRNLKTLADAIPELGHGGREVGPLLIELASQVKDGAIVDIGPYLGSTTAYLALGSRMCLPHGAPPVPIHAFDTWDANMCELKAKALKFHGMALPDDFQPMFAENMRPFGGNITQHRWDIEALPEWTYGPIGLMVDDIGVQPGRTASKMRIFGPHLAVGARVLLLDFYWYEKKSGGQFTGARDYMHEYSDRFRFEQRAGERGALFSVLQ